MPLDFTHLAHNKEATKQTKAEVKRYNMHYNVLLGRGHELTSLYKIKKLPHLFILDQKGVIQSTKRFLKTEEIKLVLDRLLIKENNKEERVNQ